MKTQEDRRAQYDRLAWKMSARTGKPFNEARAMVACRAITIYILRVSDALVNGPEPRFDELVQQYPFERLVREKVQKVPETWTGQEEKP